MRGEKGFLLLEVILSVVVVTASLIFLARSYDSSKTLVLRSDEITDAGLLFEDRMFLFEEKGLIPSKDDSGSFAEGKYGWVLRSAPLGTEAPGLNAVLLEVFPKKAPERIYGLSTFLKDEQAT